MAKKIVIIGAGIIGASIAYQLAKRGAEVVVLEAALPGRGASSKSFGWINANFAETPAYYELRSRAIDAFRALSSELDLSAAVRWHGSLWWEDGGAAFDAHVTETQSYGYDARVISDVEFRTLEPDVANPPQRCLLARREGAADAYLATRTLLKAAAECGALVMSGCIVTGFVRDGDHIVSVETTLGQVLGDGFVVAAGAATDDVLTMMGGRLPMDNKTGLIVHTLPVAPVIRHAILSPDIHFRQEIDGRIIMGEIFSGGDVAARGVEVTQEIAAGMLERLKARLPAVEDLQLGQVMLGTRPVPVDGMPAIGPVRGADGIYVACMHSGVTLAALVGELVAQEMLEEEAEIAPEFRPDRFN